MAISRSLQPRQQYGFGGIGKIFKKVTKPIKKIVKSPVGKAALLGLGAYYAPAMWGQGPGFGGWGKLGGLFKEKALLNPLNVVSKEDIFLERK